LPPPIKEIGDIVAGLAKAGVFRLRGVLVPSPQRYAVHKLIISRRRQQGAAKQDKDIRQSAALLDVLNEERPHEFKSAWEEAYALRMDDRLAIREAHTYAAAENTTLRVYRTQDIIVGLIRGKTAR